MGGMDLKLVQLMAETDWNGDHGLRCQGKAPYDTTGCSKPGP